MNGRVISDKYNFEIEGKPIHFYHNTKTHQYEIMVDYNINEPFVISKAKGEAIASFLKFLREQEKG